VGECFFLVPAHPGSPGQKAVKRLCVCGLTYLLHKSKMGRKFPRRDEYLTIGSVRCLGRQSSVVTISLFFILFKKIKKVYRILFVTQRSPTL